MTGRLDGKVAWVTGAGSGIGRATALALAREGAALVLTGRTQEALDETAALVGAAAAVEAGDVTDPDRMVEIVAAIGRRHGRLDVVVNNAGTNHPERRWRELAPSTIDRLIATNLSSAFYCVAAALPLMRSRRDGLFVHVGSRAARYWDGPSGPVYIAAKAALAAMSHTINMEECIHGIRSTVFNPGETVTPILRNRPVPVTDEELARILKPEDCASLICYVACLPPHICLNEVTMTPTWNRSLVGPAQGWAAG